jgi:hypothetical protein
MATAVSLYIPTNSLFSNRLNYVIRSYMMQAIKRFISETKDKWNKMSKKHKVLNFVIISGPCAVTVLDPVNAHEMNSAVICE